LVVSHSGMRRACWRKSTLPCYE